jgi:magnesium chelatase family protein
MQKFPAINPILTVEQAQSVTRIWSLAGLVKPTEPLIRTPPFRMPHQTASIEGMCGGGVGCRPGEISLAHNGVLFLDEAAEFRSSVLQMLRVPLETGCITLSRAGRSTVYPAQFQLLMAVNPCPCGNYGSKTKMCLCSLKSVEQYWKKFSAPLLDRVEIRVFVDKETENDAEKDRTGLETTAEIRKGIARAIAAQRKRQNVRNAKLLPAQVEELCVMEDAAKFYLDNISMKYCLSPRAMAGCLKVARTIADIEGCNFIRLHHIQEAVDLRVLKNSFLGEF